MAFTVTPLLANIDLAESATPWSTGSLDAQFFVQGNNSLAFYMAKNARGSITVTPAASVAWSTYTTPHLYFWMNSAVAGVTEPKSTGTTTASGYTVRVTLSSGAYREWHVTGSDTWDGGWERAFCIDMSHTGTQLYASSGTWTNTSNIASVTWYVDLSNSGNIRNVPANHWLDAIRVGDGLRAYNTSAADASFGFAEIAAQDEAVANKYGVMQNINDVIMSQGAVYLGDTGTNHLDFDSQDEVFVFADLDGSGDGLVSDSLYRVVVDANATGSDQDFSMGVKVGTGDSMSGRNGTIIRSAGAMTWYFDSTDADLHNFTMYGSTLRGADSVATGVDLADPTTLFEIAQTTFDACSQVDPDGATVRNCFFLNSTAVATSAALGPWVGGTTDVEYSQFVNNTNAIEFTATPTGDETDFSGLIFSGNTYAVLNESNGNDFDVNLINGSTTLVTGTDNSDTGTSTLTFVSSYAYTLTNIKNPSEVTILDFDVSLLDVTGTASNGNFGTTSLQKQGQSFQVATAGKAERIRVSVRKVGSPTDGFTVRLVNGVPGSTLLAESVPIDGADLTTSYVEFDVDLTEKNQLATATTYGIEFQRTGSLDAVNYYQVEYSATSVHGSGTRYLDAGSGWITQAGDLLFSVMEAASENTLYHEETVTSGTSTYNHPGTAKTVEVLVMSLNELQLVFYDSLTNSAKSLPVNQVRDLVYSN